MHIQLHAGQIFIAALQVSHSLFPRPLPLFNVTYKKKKTRGSGTRAHMRDISPGINLIGHGQVKGQQFCECYWGISKKNSLSCKVAIWIKSECNVIWIKCSSINWIRIQIWIKGIVPRYKGHPRGWVQG